MTKKTTKKFSSAATQDRGRFSAKRKMEAVLRLLRGEDLDVLSRELGVTAARLAQWRDDFLAAGEASLKSRSPEPEQEETLRLKAKLGDLMMRNELYEMAFEKLGVPVPFGARRSSK